MKKIIKILIIILMCIPFVVKADMGAPEIRPYYATIINPNGVDYYRYEYNSNNNTEKYIKEGHLNNGDKFKVIYEYTKDSYKMLYNGSIFQIVFDDDDNKDYYIKDDDVNYVKPIDKEYLPTKEDENYEGKIYNVKTNADVPMLKGPASTYDSVGTIPKGTKLSYKYYMGQDQITYVYLEYNGSKGWVNVENGKVLFEHEPMYFYPLEDFNTPCGKVKFMEPFKSIYYTDSWTRDFTIDTDTCSEVIVDNRVPLASKADDDFKYTLSVAKTMYYKPFGKGEKTGTIPKEKEFKILYYSDDSKNADGEYLVEYNGKTGWISLLESEIIWDHETTTTTVVTEITEETTEETNEDTTSTSTNSINKTKNIVIISAIVGVALAVTAVVVIILVNKKKKKPETVMTENDLNLVKKDDKESSEEVPAEETETEEETTKEDDKEDVE